jgi:two-component system chemotaxis response regulator CheY
LHTFRFTAFCYHLSFISELAFGFGGIVAGPQAQSIRSGRKILVVEDDRDLSLAICTVLEAEGFEVSHAANGEAALAHLRESEPPLLILLDLSMPVVNGWEFRRRQTQDPRIASVPVIVMSAYHTGVIADSSGISFYLKKPFALDTLLAYIRRLAHRSDR